MMSRGPAVALRLLTALTIVFLLAPMAAVVLVSFSDVQRFAIPTDGLSLRWYEELFDRPEHYRSIMNSLLLAAGAATVSAVLGTAASLYLARGRGRVRGVISTVVMSPLIVPQIIIGVGLLQFVAVFGIGQGIPLLLIGHVVVTIPYVVRSVQSSLSGFDESLEESSRDLGASPIATFRHITWPLIRMGIVAGWLFAFIISWINVEVSLFLISSFQAPAPVVIFNYTEYTVDPAVAALSAMSLYVAVALLMLGNRLVGVESIASTATSKPNRTR